MSADVYLYGGEADPEDVRLRSGVIGAISVTLVGVVAAAAIGIGTIKATVPVSGVAATPAIGAGAFSAKVTVSGVSATPAVGSLTFSVKTPVTGVAASPAIGSVTFNVKALITGVAGSPAIGTGTVLTPAFGNVVVALTGVTADPQIGTGTVEIEEVTVPPVEELVAGGGRWYGLPEDETVYLTGVAASPAVGKVTPIARGTLDDLAKLYPFPKRQITLEPKRIPRLVKPRVVQPPPRIAVQLAGARAMSAVGRGTVETKFEFFEDELIALLEAA